MTLADVLPTARVATTFLWRHGQLPRLARPRTYNEWVQWRKLNDRDADLALLTDKLHAKAMAASLVDPAIVIPTLWHGALLPDVAPWPMPFVVKANHGCGQFVVVRDLEDWRLAQRVAPHWLRTTYGQWLDANAHPEASNPRQRTVEKLLNSADPRLLGLRGRNAAQ